MSKLGSPYVAACAAELPAGAEAPEWIRLVPAGRFAGVDGRAWVNRDAAAVIGASAARLPLPVDYGHATDLGEPGEPNPAAGWIAELQERAGEVWGRVEWTPRGAAAVRDREYRHTSPVFVFDKRTGEVKSLLRAALTINPNLPQFAALNEQGESMDALRRLKKSLGLAEDAPDDDLCARVDALAAEAPKVRAALGVAANSSADSVVAAIQARGAPDPAKFVPIEAVTQLQADLNALKGERARERAELAVNEAVKAGKIAPALREHFLKIATNSPADFAAMMEKMPAGLGGGAPAASPPAADGGLSAEDLAVCSAMGLDPETFKKARGAEKKEAA